MQADENLADFIESQRAKIARERELLKENPASAITENSMNRELLQINKENHSPRNTMKQSLQHRNIQDVQQQQKRPPSTPRIFRLGEEYNKKREKLKEELRADYRIAMAEKNSRGYQLRNRRGDATENITASVNGTKVSDLGLSLPIRDHHSAKERLRKQRNSEYNEFLKFKEEVKMMKRGKKDQSPVHVKDSATETYEELLDRKRKQETSYRASNNNQDDEIFRSKHSGFVEEDDFDEDEGYYPQRKVRFPVKGRRAQPRGRKHRYEDDDDYQGRGRNRRGGKGRVRRIIESDEDSDDFDDDDIEYVPVSRKLRAKGISTEKKKTALSYEREATTGSIDVNTGKKNEDSLRSRSAPPEEMNTGLPIGHVPSANTVQRKKEAYRLELLQQMEEKKMTKKRAKELEMRIEASGATQPELQNIKKRDTMKSVPTKDRKDSPTPDDERTHQKKSKKKTKYKLELSSSDEEDDDEGFRRSTRRSRRAMHPQPYYMQPPMLPRPNVGYYPPQMPQYPTPYEDAYFYYGSRNPLDPPGMIPPAAPGVYQDGLPPMMTSSMPEQRVRRNADDTDDAGGATKSILRRSQQLESSLVADEKRDEEIKRKQKKSYQEELKIQIEMKNKEKQAAKAEQDRYDLKMDEEARNYNPWGKGGGGAPMKDRHGNLVSDLRSMHLENEEMVRDPTKAIEIVHERLPQTNTYRGDNRPVIDLSPRQAGDDNTSPKFGRSNPFEQKQTDEQKVQRDQYKDYLQMQIEEKKRLEAEKHERERIEEEKEERRLEEQRKKIQAELDAELEKDRNKKEMARLREEELKNKAEERKHEEMRKKIEETLRQEEELRRQKEEELDQKLKRATANKSPPVPSLQTTQSTVQEQRVIRTPQQRNTHVQPPILRGQSPALHDNRDQRGLRSRAESKRISRELSALRKQLLSEQKRVENQLRSVDQTAPYRVKTQPRANTDLPVDLSRMQRKPVAVRRPPTVENDRPSSKALMEFKDYKYRPDDADSASLRMFKTEYPESPTDGRSLEQQQRALIAKQGQTLDSLRHQRRSDEQPTYSKRKGPIDTRPPSSAVSRASLLEAETAYIPVIMDDEFDDRPLINSSQTTPRQSRHPSARERRRMAQKPPSAQSERKLPPSGRPDNYSLNSLTSLATLDVERMANKNRDRLDKLQAIQGDDVSLTDPDDILDRFVNKHKGSGGQRLHRDPDVVELPIPNFNTRPPSVNTIDTEPWLRPETGATHA